MNEKNVGILCILFASIMWALEPILSAFLITTKNIKNIAMLKFGSFGDVLVLMATIARATTAIVVRKYLMNENAGIITFYRFFIASIIFIVWIQGLKIENIYQIYVGLVVAVGTIFYYEELKRIKAAKVASLELSSPFFASILALLILKEMITWMQILGIIILFSGIYFLW